MPQKAAQLLKEQLIKILDHTGHQFIVLEDTGKKNCFDILAKKRNRQIIIKIEPYIDNFSGDSAKELKQIAAFLEASPLIIGVRGRRFKEIDDGLVLLRYGVPVISPETFAAMMIHNIPPIVYCNRGGYFVKINRNLLRQARIEKNLSYADLAHLVGVSRRTIYEYEHSISPPPEIAAKLEEVLGTPLVSGIKIFDIKIEREEIPEFSAKNLSPFKDEIAQLLRILGINSQFWIQRSPFDAIGEHQNQSLKSGLNVLLCVDEDVKRSVLAERTEITQSIALLTKRRAILIVEEEDQSLNIPTFTIEELQQMKRAFELVKKWVKKYSELKDNKEQE